MKTSLPTLSYTPGGLWALPGPTLLIVPHAQNIERIRGRTWRTSSHGIHLKRRFTTCMTAMKITPDTEYVIGSMPKKRDIVMNEEDVRWHAKAQLHDLVNEVLDTLGIEGRFTPPGSGNNQIIGEPDFSWLRNLTMHPKVVVCVLLISVNDCSYCGAGGIQDKMGSSSSRLGCVLTTKKP